MVRYSLLKENVHLVIHFWCMEKDDTLSDNDMVFKNKKKFQEATSCCRGNMIERREIIDLWKNQKNNSTRRSRIVQWKNQGLNGSIILQINTCVYHRQIVGSSVTWKANYLPRKIDVAISPTEDPYEDGRPNDDQLVFMNEIHFHSTQGQMEGKREITHFPADPSFMQFWTWMRKIWT